MKQLVTDRGVALLVDLQKTAERDPSLLLTNARVRLPLSDRRSERLVDFAFNSDRKKPFWRPCLNPQVGLGCARATGQRNLEFWNCQKHRRAARDWSLVHEI